MPRLALRPLRDALRGPLRALAFLALLAAPSGTSAAEPLVVFAAASLKDALDAAAERWEAETGGEVAISYAGSAALAQQIRHGAPAEVFISAHVDWMNALESEGLIRSETRRDLLGNDLVLIAHGQDAPEVKIGPGLDLEGLLGGGRLAMAMVEAVPAGVYGRAALDALGLWDSVADRVAQSENVRAALALVGRGEAPLGIVYATDAAAEDAVSVVGSFPTNSHPPIIYPAALTSFGVSDAAAGFLDYLASPAGLAFFKSQGFSVLTPVAVAAR